jgi:hypothetical protein
VPTGPKGEKPPADAIAGAVKVMRILTGEEPEDYCDALQEPSRCGARPQRREEARRGHDGRTARGDR